MKSPCQSKAKDVCGETVDNINLIKTEVDHNEVVGDSVDVQIKIENDPHSDHNNIENSNANLQQQFKVEVDSSINVDPKLNPHNSPYNGALNLLKSKSKRNEENHLEMIISTKAAEDSVSQLKIEYENYTLGNSEITDARSMDSNEATALGNVETSLQEEILNIKNEFNINYEDDQELNDVELKLEPNKLRTLLTSKKHFNTTATITNLENGFIESQTNNGLLMKILPIVYSGPEMLQDMCQPEEILPTTNHNNEYYNGAFDNTFQLNSITGNVLSLEQEAFGLLKAKRKVETEHKKYFCTKCTKCFKRSQSLKHHLKVHSSIERRAQGVVRGLETKKENLKKKRKLKSAFKFDTMNDTKIVENGTKLEGYICTCGKKFRRRTRMETCLRSHDMYSDTNTRHPCVTCSKVFKSKEDLTAHRKRLHNKKKFPCKFCPTDYNTRKELFKHLQIHQKVQLTEYKAISEIMKAKKKLRCFMCSKSYSQLSQLKFHVMDDHKGPYVCRHCKETFPKIVDFANHIRKMHPKIEGQTVLDVLEAFSKLVKAWKCEECEVQFHEPDKLAMHQIEKHGPDSKANVQFQCEDCRRVFFSQKGLQSHRRIHHSSETIEEVDVAEKGIICLECRKICKDMTALTSHMRLHSPERKYPCKFCDFRFTTPEKRKAHAEVHTGDMKYVCFICDYQCSSENRLKYHKMTPKHVNMKEYLLTGKPIETIQPDNQRENMKEGDKYVEKIISVSKKKIKSDSSNCDDGEATCDICGDNFPNEAEMLNHKETHPFIEIPSEDKPTRIFFK